MSGCRRTSVTIIAAGVLSVACSHSQPASSGGSTQTTPTSTPSSATSSAGVDVVQRYLDAVNRLCDGLLPKVIAVTGGGSFDIPLKDFFKQLPEHSRLRAEFDHNLARIPVPTAARSKADALNAYIRFANTLDARRLRAARQGNASYQREISAEKKSAANDPSIAARTAAGFSESCDAR